MKPPILLKTILDICYFILIVGFVAAIIVLIPSLISPEFFVPIKLNGWEIENWTLSTSLLLFFNVIISGLFISCIYYLRKLIRNFFRNIVFSREQEQYLKITGRLIVIISITNSLLSFAADLIIDENNTTNIHLDSSFGSFWFTLALGLFFIYLSKVFENARKLKEENEFTV